MKKPTNFYMDGAQIKSIDLPQYPDESWDWLTGKPMQETKRNELYSRVSAVFRVANMTADAVSNMPFAIINSAGKTIDDSDSWQNVVGFLPKPHELLKQWRLSLFMSNAAYGFKEGSRMNYTLRYLLPESITPVVDKWDGLTGFQRKLGESVREYSLKDDVIFWMWKLDHTTELLPSDYTEMGALMSAAGVLFYADYYTEKFLQRGGIKPALLGVTGAPSVEDRDRIENIWTKVVTGAYKYLGKVINAETMTVNTIGEGLENLKDSQLQDAKIEEIAMAAGIPLSLLLANSANYATAKEEKITWLRDKVVPDCQFIQEEINLKLMLPTGYQFEFRPELKSEDQEEEKERAIAYSQYIRSGIKPSIAAQIVGIDLPAEIEYQDLDAMTPPPPQPTNQPPLMVEQAANNNTPTRSVALNTEQVRELALWEDIAARKLKRGDGLEFPFVCKHLSESTAAQIRAGLKRCRTVEELKAVFDLQEEQQDTGIMALVEALNRAAEREMEAK